MADVTFPIDFNNIFTATFIERPNRFLVRCVADGPGIIDAHLPNPGRLRELLLPGAGLYIYTGASSDRVNRAHRKTIYTVLAVERKGRPIFLHTHITNKVARYLIERRLIPTLEKAEVAKKEVPRGRSRFDFLLREGGKDVYMEVKSCTLFGNDVAMFPDAVTERGRRHLLELAEMARKGIRSMVLFVVHYPHVKWFMPDFHTDYDFSTTMLDIKNDLVILPVSIEWSPDLTIGRNVKILEIPWDYLQQEVKDRGSYLLILRFKDKKPIEVGKLGKIMIQEGYYIYVGSAMSNLSARIKRHRQKRKKMHWHIDYLSGIADEFFSIPIRSSQRQECEIAHALSSIMSQGASGFGSSDCRCATHLFWTKNNPFHMESFHDVMQRFMMRHPS
jgi:sugar fermentation stimulation protein A